MIYANLRLDSGRIMFPSCDASSVGSGAIICHDFHTAHKQWTEMEAKQSSTWRELETIHYAICSFLPIVSNSQLKVYTDNQATTKIVESGSMKPEFMQGKGGFSLPMVAVFLILVSRRVLLNT